MKKRLTIILLLLGLAGILFSCQRNKGPDDPPSRGIWVSAVGRVQTSADTTQISLSIVTEDKRAEMAQRENTKIADRVLETLKSSFSVPPKNIQTRSFDLSPIYDYRDRERVFRGFKSVHGLNIEVSSLEVGKLLDVLVEKGVTKINSVHFTRKNFEKQENRALKRALERAEKKAQILAKSSGRKLGKVINIRQGIHSSKGLEGGTMKALSAFESDSSTSLEPGELTISAHLRVRFSIL